LVGIGPDSFAFCVIGTQGKFTTAPFGGELALYCGEKLKRVVLAEGAWHTAPNQSRPQNCVIQAEVDAEH
jgi:hypothetical protein